MAASRDDDDITAAKIDTYTKLRQTMSAQQALSQAGIELTDEEAKKFDALTQRAGQAAQAAANAKAAFTAQNQALQAAGDQAISAIDGRDLPKAPGPRTEEAIAAFARVISGELD